jgi:hypothetical protein
MRLIFLLIIPVIILIGCGDTADEQPEEIKDFGEMEFEIHEKLLGTTVIDSALGISFKAPAGWTALPEDMEKEVFAGIDSIAAGETGIEQKPVYIFSDSLNYGMLFVTAIRFPNAITEKEAVEKYEAFIADRFTKDERQEALYRKGALNVHQYLITREDLITYKLMFPNNQGYLLQFDYTVIRDNLPFAIKAIESSIGTIELLYQ